MPNAGVARPGAAARMAPRRPRAPFWKLNSVRLSERVPAMPPAKPATRFAIPFTRGSRSMSTSSPNCVSTSIEVMPRTSVNAVATMRAIAPPVSLDRRAAGGACQWRSQPEDRRSAAWRGIFSSQPTAWPSPIENARRARGRREPGPIDPDKKSRKAIPFRLRSVAARASAKEDSRDELREPDGRREALRRESAHPGSTRVENAQPRSRSGASRKPR